MKKYILDGKQLKELLVAANQFWALEQGGVDNWEWCGESCCNFLEEYGAEAGREFEDFEEMAEYDMTFYEAVEIEEGD